MPEAYIVEAVRTAGGRRGGRLAGVHPVDLAATSLDAVMERSGLEAKAIDDVVMGCVSQGGEQAMQVGADDPAAGAAWLWRRCLLREARRTERDRLLALLQEERALGASEADAWGVVASVVMCLDEFVSRR